MDCFRRISDTESVAEHQYRMALMGMLIVDPSVDRNRIIKMALVHDITEALVGDIMPVRDSGVTKREKQILEQRAMDQLCATLLSSQAPHPLPASADTTTASQQSAEGGVSASAHDLSGEQTASRFADELCSLWEEYEAGSTLEAKFVKDFDKLEMMMQALEYELAQSIDLSQFFGAAASLTQQSSKALANDILARHETLKGTGKLKVVERMHIPGGGLKPGVMRIPAAELE